MANTSSFLQPPSACPSQISTPVTPLGSSSQTFLSLNQCFTPTTPQTAMSAPSLISPFTQQTFIVPSPSSVSTAASVLSSPESASQLVTHRKASAPEEIAVIPPPPPPPTMQQISSSVSHASAEETRPHLAAASIPEISPHSLVSVTPPPSPTPSQHSHHRRNASDTSAFDK